MGNMTYEQFEHWCKYWNLTIEEGYKAICFTANLIGQNLDNWKTYADDVYNENHTDAFKDLIKKIKDDAIILLVLFNKFESNMFSMLDKHDKEQAKESNNNEIKE